MISVSLSLKDPRRSSRTDLTVRLEAFYHHLTLSLVLPEIPGDLLLFGIILTDPKVIKRPALPSEM
jgi:hypothetical protein